MENYVHRETAVARMKPQDAATVIKQEEEDMRNAENVGVTTRMPKITLLEMLNDCGAGLNNLASSDNGQDSEDEHDDNEEDTGLGKLKKDDKSGWVIGTISRMVHYHMEWCLEQ